MIKAYDLAPNACTYSIISKGYSQAGQLEKALETFKMMELNGQDIGTQDGTEWKTFKMMELNGQDIGMEDGEEDKMGGLDF